MITTSYEYYAETYGGSLSEDTFNKILPDAETYIENRTFGNVDSIDEDSPYVNQVRRTVCKVVDLVSSRTNYKTGIMDNRVVSSESVGGWSKTYKTGGNNEDSALFERDIYNLIETFLGSTGLLFGGVC